MTACTQLWNFMYIDDAGRALADLAEYAGNLTDHGCVYNLGGPMDETGPLRGFVETVYELCGRQGSMEFGVRPPISARWSGWLAGSHRYILKKE